MNINMAEILEYISYVDPILPALDVPKIPIPKESHFNFLKPGSKEVLTRPVHIHEHLPPLNPPEDDPMNTLNDKDIIDVVGVPMSGDDVFKRPEGSEGPAKKIKLEDEGRATREISSVMMTTSGFISPAREGKLPESRPPKLPEEFPKTVASPMISPKSSFKSKDPAVAVSLGEKKLEKKLKKKSHEKERKKDKHIKEKFPLPDPSALDQYNPPVIPPAIPREADEQLLMAERKKELKKLKMKTKEEKKKKEKPSKAIFTPLKFDPFEVLPPTPASSQSCQAHNFLTGAAHSLFGASNILDQNIFGESPPVLSSQINPLIDGKLVSEPDKNKLNIFKKIQRQPKEDQPPPPMKVSPQMPDFFTPSKLDQHSFQPEQKIPKLPKDTTLTRIDEPMNLSGQAFEQPQLPKTPTIPQTPDFKLQQSLERKEKKERKKREKQLQQQQQHQQQQIDWAAQQQSYSNAFENNPFLQSLQSSLMNPFLNATRNPFDIFPSAPGLIPQFGMNQSLLNPFTSPGMNLGQSPMSHSSSSKKVKQIPQQNDMFQMGSKFCNVPSLLPASTVPPSIAPKERSYQTPLNIPEPSNVLPLQQQINSTFDQLLKDQQANTTSIVSPAKRLLEKEMETFDLTKDSSPEPTMSVMPNALIAPSAVEPSFKACQIEPEPDLEVPVVKEKSKEKKKKKDKDKERDKDKEERKKVSYFKIYEQIINIFINNCRKRKKRRRKRTNIRKSIEHLCQLLTARATTLKTLLTMAQLHRCPN
jgi:transcription initiation factor TFIID subunit 3